MLAATRLVGGTGRAASLRLTISSTTTTTADFDGHGTHVGGTIGQLTNTASARGRCVQRQS
jgi:hypothetical protein